MYILYVVLVDISIFLSFCNKLVTIVYIHPSIHPGCVGVVIDIMKRFCKYFVNKYVHCGCVLV